MRLIIYLSILFLLGISQISQAQNIYFPPDAPSNDWETTAPEDLGWCTDSIQALYQYLDSENTRAFLLLKDGKIVLEQYFGTHTQDSIWVWFSAGKSLRAALVGIAQEEGLLNIQDKTSDYLGRGWTNMDSLREDSIKIWHQLTMTTGIDPNISFDCTDPSCLEYAAPVGTQWVYHNSPYNLLKDVLGAATGTTLNAYTNAKIRQPIGMRALSSFWVTVGNNMFYLSTARDMARFGILIQNKGIWDGDTILRDSTYYNAMINPSQTINPSYGYLWWLNGQSSYIPPSPVVSIPGQFSPNAPSDVYTAAGSQGQYISISPSTGLMMIRQGSSNDSDKAAINLHDEIWGKLMNLSCPTSTVLATSNLNYIRLLPNPIDGNQLQIQGLEGQFNHSIEISFCDLLGKCHLRVDQLTKNTIDISALGRGIYFVTFRNEDGTVYTQKLIRN